MTRAAVPAATLSLVVALLAPPSAAQDTFLIRPPPTCTRPTTCASGLWSAAACRCECIPPICRNATGSCAAGPGFTGACDANPWEDCTLGADCPWWDNDLRKAESCTTRRRVPPGVWVVHASEADCCAAHHPNSTHCGARAGPAAPPPTSSPTLRASLYEVVPVKFVVGGLPAAVDKARLPEEMMRALRRALTDIAARVPDLKITDVVESDPFAAGNDRVKLGGATGNGARNGNRKERFYYDVTVLRHPNKNRKFGPLIITALRDSYEEILWDIENSIALDYFGKGLSFVWCVSDDEGQFDKCSVNEQTVPIPEPVTIDVPQGIFLSTEDFIERVQTIYEAHLEEIDKLDIIEVEVVEIDRVGWTKGLAKDFFLTIRHEGDYDINDFWPAIRTKLRRVKNDIADEIETYLTTETGVGTPWYRDAEGSYTMREEEVEEEMEEEIDEDVEKVVIIIPEEDPPFFEEEDPPRFPLWAMIAVAAIAGLLFLCCCVCFVRYDIKRRDRRRSAKQWSDLAHLPVHRSPGSYGDERFVPGPPPRGLGEAGAARRLGASCREERPHDGEPGTARRLGASCREERPRDAGGAPHREKRPRDAGGRTRRRDSAGRKKPHVRDAGAPGVGRGAPVRGALLPVSEGAPPRRPVLTGLAPVYQEPRLPRQAGERKFRALKPDLELGVGQGALVRDAPLLMLEDTPPRRPVPPGLAPVSQEPRLLKHVSERKFRALGPDREGEVAPSRRRVIVKSSSELGERPSDRTHKKTRTRRRHSTMDFV